MVRDETIPRSGSAPAGRPVTREPDPELAVLRMRFNSVQERTKRLLTMVSEPLSDRPAEQPGLSHT